jgi:DNA-binding MarR family transcriptional regulator
LFCIFTSELQKCETKYCGCLYYSVNALSRAITKMADEEFSKAGLQSSSYAFLLMTVNENPGIQPKEISEYMQLTPSTVTRLIEKMEMKSLLKREHSGRITKVFPTPNSLDLDNKIKEAWHNLHIRYSKILGEDESRKLTDLNFDAYNKIK